MLAQLQEIVERIMTLHWDMAACRCWLCVAGRRAGCAPREQYLALHDETKDGLATGK